MRPVAHLHLILYNHYIYSCFRQTKFASFQRQLNLYGFRRITTGKDKGGYYHELFLRGRTLLALKMQRTKVKGTGARKPSQPDTEPDFYAMPFVHDKESKKPAPVVASPTATMPVAVMSPSPPLAASYIFKFAPSPPLSGKPIMHDSVSRSAFLGMGGMNASGNAIKSNLSSLMTNATRREIIEEMLANSARMQSLANAGSSSGSHAVDYPSSMRHNSSGSLPSGYDHALMVAGSSSQCGPLHLNALNMPCVCAIPAF